VTSRRVSAAPSGGAERPVTFTFDGREYEGIEGEPLAVALLAHDRLILSRSFRFHRPRGLMCSTGQCGWCECEVDGRPSVRSCRVPVREGLVARGEHALPSVERDLLSLVGLFSRWIPPTFYHHRFLRPRRLRRRYLDVLRFMGGRGRLRMGPRVASPGRVARQLSADVLVVGGGRAGLLAAIGAAEGGARVVLIEAEPTLAGGWRVDVASNDDAGAIEALAAEAAQAGVMIMPGVVATGWYDGTVTASSDAAHLEIRADAVVAATGSYERVPLVPGADRPGVMGARTVAALVSGFGVLPGSRALLVGDADALVMAGRLLATSGASVVGPLPTEALLSVLGHRQVTGAVTRSGRARERIAVDLVVFGDRSPNLDLLLAAGAGVTRAGGRLVPVTDACGRTTQPSLFVVGSSAGRPICRAADAEAARATGRSAAAQAAGAASDWQVPDNDAVVTAGRRSSSRPARVAPNSMVCFCEDVRAFEIRADQAHGYEDPELIKRRTGALTGPCQGKYCLQAFGCLAGSPSADGPVALPTARPPLRPVRLGDLVSAPARADGDSA
jgi:sarcosine oxidase subunit alpha